MLVVACDLKGEGKHQRDPSLFNIVSWSENIPIRPNYYFKIGSIFLCLDHIFPFFYFHFLMATWVSYDLHFIKEWKWLDRNGDSLLVL